MTIEVKRRIDRLHEKNEFKLKPMQYFNYKEEKTDMNMSPEDEILKALEKAVAKKEKRAYYWRRA